MSFLRKENIIALNCQFEFQGCDLQCCSRDLSETSHLCWNNETIRFKSSLTSIIIESTYLTLNMNKIWGCFKVQVGWKNWFYGETGVSKRSRKGLETRTMKKTFLTFTLSVNKIILYQFSMFKSLDSIASVVGMFMYLTISKLKQVLRSRKGLDYNTGDLWKMGSGPGSRSLWSRGTKPPERGCWRICRLSTSPKYQETRGLDTTQATSFFLFGGYFSSFKKMMRQMEICKLRNPEIRISIMRNHRPFKT